jgi:feruloyl esterase
MELSLKNHHSAFIASAVIAMGWSVPAFAAGTEISVSACSALAKLALPAATITSAESVGAGEYQMPPAVQGLSSRPGMNVAGRILSGPNPAFCRVAATLKPTTDSDIKIEVWLPQEGWNGKLLTAGNFGWAGSLMLGGMLTGLEAGYATASTDTGHDGNGGKFALGHPEKLIDYAYRADHELTVDAKAVIKAFYGKGPTHSYWIGCSLGGLEGLIEAKRFPEDYDGIVAGAPPNPLARFNALQLWPDYLISQQPDRLIPKEKYAMVHQAVLNACASPIGRKQGLVDEPDKCGFDPAQLQCKGEDGPDCLTAPQVYLLQQTYRGPLNPRTKELIFPGPARGTELDMYNFASGEAPSVALDLFRYVAFQNPDWNWKTMDWDRDVAAAIEKVGPLMHVDADLKPFIDRGGKLLFYIGWNDYHNPEQLIDYYKSVMKSGGGEKARNSLRLFAIPGMGHCMGGAGCDTFDKLGAIDAWVARGEAPQRISAARVEEGKIVRTRPLCAYPEVARYKGSGDINDAVSFACSSR